MIVCACVCVSVCVFVQRVSCTSHLKFGLHLIDCSSLPSLRLVSRCSGGRGASTLSVLLLLESFCCLLLDGPGQRSGEGGEQCIRLSVCVVVVDVRGVVVVIRGVEVR